MAIGDGKWEIYIGGAAGGTVRKGDLLCTVEGHEQVLTYMGPLHPVLPGECQIPGTHLWLRRARRYCPSARSPDRRHGRRLLRAWDAEIDKAVAAYRDPWSTEAVQPRNVSQFAGPLPVEPTLQEALQ